MKVFNKFQLELERWRFDIQWGGPDLDWYWWSTGIETKDKTWEHGGETFRTRRWDFARIWYDGPIIQVNLWYVWITWSTPWTLPAFDYLNKETQEEWLKKPKFWRKFCQMQPYDEYMMDKVK